MASNKEKAINYCSSVVDKFGIIYFMLFQSFTVTSQLSRYKMYKTIPTVEFFDYYKLLRKRKLSSHYNINTFDNVPNLTISIRSLIMVLTTFQFNRRRRHNNKLLLVIFK